MATFADALRAGSAEAKLRTSYNDTETYMMHSVQAAPRQRAVPMPRSPIGADALRAGSAEAKYNNRYIICT